MIDEDDFPEDESITKWTHGTESLLPQERNPQQQRTLFKLQLLSWTAQLLLFIFSVLLLHQAMSLRGADSINCVQKHSMFSPATGAVHDDYEIWRFNGTFRFVSPYKGPPSVSVDTSWKEITEPTTVGVVSISNDTLRKIGASKDSVILPPESGGGYMGSLEVFHQLHCVNLLWQATYVEYYEDKSRAWNDSAATLRQHLDHCADLLRQKLMCDADVGIFTYNWVKDHRGPYPNFNTLHKCRNFDDVLAWAKARRAPKPNGGFVKKPNNAVEMELPP